MPPIRIGVLGAARIAPSAIVRPAQHVPEVEVTAVAARDAVRARAFADHHGIGRVLDSYQALVDDDQLDAIYIPLPNGLHGRWTKAALAARKHVLCEKPFTANGHEARSVAEAVAAAPGLVVMEAFHYRYHPLFTRARQLLDEGAIGEIRHVETALCFPLPNGADIRWQLALAGGALMDAGCYAVHMLRHLAGTEPKVESARARLRSPGVDRFVQAYYRFDDGATGRTTCSMWSSSLLRIGFRVEGTEGVLRVFNPLAPDRYHRLLLQSRSGRHVERVVRRPTYEFQLEAFADAVLRGIEPVTGVRDAVANMDVMDAVYRAAGMEPRQPSS